MKTFFEDKWLTNTEMLFCKEEMKTVNANATLHATYAGEIYIEIIACMNWFFMFTGHVSVSFDLMQ